MGRRLLSATTAACGNAARNFECCSEEDLLNVRTSRSLDSSYWPAT
jgi:hypothetical protein